MKTLLIAEAMADDDSADRRSASLRRLRAWAGVLAKPLRLGIEKLHVEDDALIPVRDRYVPASGERRVGSSGARVVPLSTRGVAVSISRAVDPERHAMLAVAPRARSKGTDWVFPGVSSRLVGLSRAPILCIGPRCEAPPRSLRDRAILVCTDLGPSGNRSVAWAAQLASGLRSSIVVYHWAGADLHPVLRQAISIRRGREDLSGALSDLLRKERERLDASVGKLASEIRIDFAGSSAEQGILEAARQTRAWAIVVGSRRETAKRRRPAILGSVAKALLRSARGALIVVGPLTPSASSRGSARASQRGSGR